jgi:hypothetical protein
MVRSRIIKIHRPLHEAQTEKPDIKVEVPLRVASDRSDVMQSRNFTVHHDGNDLRLVLRADASACGLPLVFKGQLQSSSKLKHFPVLNLHIHFHNLGNTQITQRPRRSLHGSFCRIFPGLSARPDYFRYSVN